VTHHGVAILVFDSLTRTSVPGLAEICQTARGAARVTPAVISTGRRTPRELTIHESRRVYHPAIRFSRKGQRSLDIPPAQLARGWQQDYVLFERRERDQRAQP
jgi:hypothetical protein